MATPLMTFDEYLASRGLSGAVGNWTPQTNALRAQVPAHLQNYLWQDGQSNQEESSENMRFDANGQGYSSMGKLNQGNYFAPGKSPESYGAIYDNNKNIWFPNDQAAIQRYQQDSPYYKGPEADSWNGFSNFLSDYGPLIAGGGMLAAGAAAGAGAAGIAGETGLGAGWADAAFGNGLGGAIGGGEFAGAGLGGVDFSGATYGNASGIGEGTFQNVSMQAGEGFTPFGENAIDLADAASGGSGVSGAGSGASQSWIEQLQQYLSNPQNLAQSAASNAATSGFDALSGEDAAQGTAMQQALNQGGGPGINSPLTTGGAAGAGTSALKWLSEATGIPEGALSTLGTLGQGGLGILSGLQQSNATSDIANNLRADRLPALNAFNNALNNPNSWYQSAPAMGATDSVLRKLSMQGNPANNPGALSQAAAYNLGGYNDHLRALSGPAFGTASSESNINLAGVQQQGGAWEAGGSLLQNLFNPKQNYGLNLGSWLT